MEDGRNFMGVPDDQVQGKTWPVGDRLSHADFRVATCFPFAEAAGLPIAEFRNVQRFADQLSRIAAWHDPFHGLV